jgi:hypothetical protein
VPADVSREAARIDADAALAAIGAWLPAAAGSGRKR